MSNEIVDEGSINAGENLDEKLEYAEVEEIEIEVEDRIEVALFEVKTRKTKAAAAGVGILRKNMKFGMHKSLQLVQSLQMNSTKKKKNNKTTKLVLLLALINLLNDDISVECQGYE